MHPIWLIVLERCFASAGRRAKGLTRAFEVRTVIGISTLGSRYRFPLERMRIVPCYLAIGRKDRDNG